MRVLGWEELVAQPGVVMTGERYAATVGVFDGMHRGHKLLMRHVSEHDRGLLPMAVTFAQNPKKLLHPASFRGDLQSLGQKLDSIEAEGIAVCVLIDFSLDFGTLSGAEFLALLEKSGVRHLCVGPNFRCGHHMDTNAEMLVSLCERLGIEAEIAQPVLYSGHPVSSSRIRQAVLEGRLEDARAMLGRPYSVRLEADGDEGAFRVQGGVVLPPDGDYRVVSRPDEAHFSTVVSITGVNLAFRGGLPGGMREIAILDMVSKV